MDIIILIVVVLLLYTLVAGMTFSFTKRIIKGKGPYDNGNITDSIEGDQILFSLFWPIFWLVYSFIVVAKFGMSIISHDNNN